MGIAQRREIHFAEIGTDEDQVHFPAQDASMVLRKAVVQIAKTIAVREMLRTHTYVKKMLWGGKFCTATLAWGEHRRATWQ
ncbi:MAG: hypothetical protein ABSD38_29545 [Syntrophorhabdales bacterium]|jgi:hypothetical protein